jgi:hypothetical protein
MENMCLYSFFKFVKRAPQSVMTVVTSDGDTYKFQYVKDERLWRVEHAMTHTLFPFIDMKKNVNKLVSRIGNVVEVVIQNV